MRSFTNIIYYYQVYLTFQTRLIIVFDLTLKQKYITQYK